MLFNEPARKIPKNYRNITGKFSSKKANRLLGYESKLERDFLYIFEFENIVLNILEQPVIIRDNNFKYTPDFYIKTPNEYNDIIVEVKYYDDLKDIIRDSKNNYKIVLEYIKDKNLDFYFFTDRCPYIKSDNYKFNVHFLLNFNELDEQHYNIVIELFKPSITIQEILQKHSDNNFLQLELLNTIWCMIRRKILIVDLFEKLTIYTELIQLRKYDENTYKKHLSGKIDKGYLL